MGRCGLPGAGVDLCSDGGSRRTGLCTAESARPGAQRTSGTAARGCLMCRRGPPRRAQSDPARTRDRSRSAAQLLLELRACVCRPALGILHGHAAGPRHGRHPGGGGIRRVRHPVHGPRVGSRGGHPGVQPGRDGAAVGPALLARYPAHGAHVCGSGPVEPRDGGRERHLPAPVFGGRLAAGRGLSLHACPQQLRRDLPRHRLHRHLQPDG
jgi:hypothetical protein